MNNLDLGDIDSIVDYIMEKNNIDNKLLQKYYSLQWFLYALKQDKYTFQKPSSWDDPFEDFISKLTNYHKDAFVNAFNITDNIYAMSTIRKNTECDGMWNNFAKSTGVLIHIRPKKIIKSIVTFLINNGCCDDRTLYLNNFDLKQTFANSIKLKKINYITDDKIAKKFILLTKKEQEDYNKISFDLLSIKRTEFGYESEYRIFLIAEKLGLREEDFLKVGSFIDTIDKVVLAPSANQTRVNRLTSILECKYNIDKKIIEKSKLYDIEHFRQKHGFN